MSNVHQLNPRRTARARSFALVASSPPHLVTLSPCHPLTPSPPLRQNHRFTLLAALLAAALTTTSLRAADPPAPVDSAREALGKQKYPWYDAQKDALRPVELPAPKKPKKSSSNGAAGGGTTADVSPLEGHDGSVGPGEMSEAEDLPDLNIPAGAAQGLSVFAILVLVLLVGGLIAVIVYLILQNVRQKPAETVQVTRRPVSHDDRMEALPQPARKHVDDLLAEARRCYQEGRYGEAIVYLFSHQLLELDKSQLIRLGRGKTNRQYLTEVAARPPLRELVGQTMVVFEDAFFGNYPIEQQRFESCWVQLDTFRRLVAQGGV